MRFLITITLNLGCGGMHVIAVDTCQESLKLYPKNPEWSYRCPHLRYM